MLRGATETVTDPVFQRGGFDFILKSLGVKKQKKRGFFLQQNADRVPFTQVPAKLYSIYLELHGSTWPYLFQPLNLNKSAASG